jgi:hypothetical protein
VSKVGSPSVVVEAANRFRPSLALLPAPGGDGPENLKTKLALLVTLNPEHFEAREVAAWTAYLRDNLIPLN